MSSKLAIRKYIRIDRKRLKICLLLSRRDMRICNIRSTRLSPVLIEVTQHENRSLPRRLYFEREKRITSNHKIVKNTLQFKKSK